MIISTFHMMKKFCSLPLCHAISAEGGKNKNLQATALSDFTGLICKGNGRFWHSLLWALVFFFWQTCTWWRNMFPWWNSLSFFNNCINFPYFISFSGCEEFFSNFLTTLFCTQAQICMITNKTQTDSVSSGLQDIFPGCIFCPPKTRLQ